LEREVLAELFNNALKYTADDGVITVALHQERGDVVFSVQDTGMGMSESEKNAVWRNGYHVPSLYMLKKVIEGDYHGTVDLKSEKGKGSIFTVRIPRGDVADSMDLAQNNVRYPVQLAQLTPGTWRAETKQGVYTYKLHTASPDMPKAFMEQAGKLLSEVYDTEGDEYLLHDIFLAPAPGVAATLLSEGDTVVGILVSYLNQATDKVSPSALAVDRRYRGTGAADILFEDFKQRWGGGKFYGNITRPSAPQKGLFIDATVDEIKERLGIRSSVTVVDQAENMSVDLLAEKQDPAALTPGGIDLNAKKMSLNVRSSGEGVQFNFDPATVKQFQNASGFTPVIISIQPMIMSLPTFLGISDNVPASEAALR
jgi:hypothetical protein